MDISNIINNLNTSKGSNDSTLKIDMEKSYNARLSGLSPKQAAISVSAGSQQVTLPIPDEVAAKLDKNIPYRVKFTVSNNAVVANIFKTANPFGDQLSQLQTPHTSTTTTTIPLSSQATFALLKILVPKANQSKANQSKANEFKTEVSVQKHGGQVSLGGTNGITLPIPSALKPLVHSAQPTTANIKATNGKITAQIPVSKQGNAGPIHSIPIPKQHAEQWLQKLASSSSLKEFTATQITEKQLQLNVNGKTLQIDSLSKASQIKGTASIVDGKLVIVATTDSKEPNKSEKPVATLPIKTLSDNLEPSPKTQNGYKVARQHQEAESNKSTVNKLAEAVKQLFSKENIQSANTAPLDTKLHRTALTSEALLLAQKVNAQSSNLNTNVSQQLSSLESTPTDKPQPATANVVHSPLAISKSVLQYLEKQLPTQQKATEHDDGSLSSSVKPTKTSENTGTQTTSSSAINQLVKQAISDVLLNEDTVGSDSVQENISQQLNHTLQPLLNNSVTFSSSIALALQALLGKRLQAHQTNNSQATEKSTEKNNKQNSSKESTTLPISESEKNIASSTNTKGAAVTNKEMLTQLQKLMEQLEGNDEKLQKSLLGIHQTLRAQQSQNLERANEQLLHLQLVLPLKHDNDNSDVHIEIKEEETNENGKAQNIWQVTLTFNLPKLGKLLATAKLQQSEVDIKLYSEHNDALKKAKRYSDLLSERLIEQGLTVKAIQCSLGKIPERTQKNSVHLLQVKV